jgi:hypothetical protein
LNTELVNLIENFIYLGEISDEAKNEMIVDSEKDKGIHIINTLYQKFLKRYDADHMINSTISRRIVENREFEFIMESINKEYKNRFLRALSSNCKHYIIN